DLPVKRVRIADEYAVLVGNYKSLDAAGAALKDVKKLDPPQQASVPMLASGTVNSNGRSSQRAKVNPFRMAWAVRNPLAPKEGSVAAEDGGALPPWMKLNQQERYCLLANPRTWTVVVKAYGGHAATAATSKPGIFDKIKSAVSSSETDLKIDEKALQA